MDKLRDTEKSDEKKKNEDLIKAFDDGITNFDQDLIKLVGGYVNAVSRIYANALQWSEVGLKKQCIINSHKLFLAHLKQRWQILIKDHMDNLRDIQLNKRKKMAEVGRYMLADVKREYYNFINNILNDDIGAPHHDPK
jgi:hypothetical protein